VAPRVELDGPSAAKSCIDDIGKGRAPAVVVAVAGEEDDRALWVEGLDGGAERGCVDPIIHSLLPLTRLALLNVGAVAFPLPGRPHRLFARMSDPGRAAHESFFDASVALDTLCKPLHIEL
jgi:hypothetical protein